MLFGGADSVIQQYPMHGGKGSRRPDEMKPIGAASGAVLADENGLTGQLVGAWAKPCGGDCIADQDRALGGDQFQKGFQQEWGKVVAIGDQGDP